MLLQAWARCRTPLASNAQLISRALISSAGRPVTPAAAMAPKRKAAAPPEAAADDAGPSSSSPGAAAAPEAGASSGAAAKASKPKAKRAPAKPKAPAGPLWDASMRAPPLPEGTPACRILSWNVAGLRALLKKVKEVESGARQENIPSPLALAEAEAADVLCLQEIKLQDEHCPDVQKDLGLPDGWHVSWNCSTEKKGYSGTAILSRQAPLSVAAGIGQAAHDGEGRVLTAEFEAFFLVSVYVPNSGEGLKRLDYRVGEWDRDFAAYLKALEARGKPVVVTGDLNVAPTELDIHNPKTNLKSAGFTPQERASFAERLVPGGGLVDAFRAQHPTAVAYTYWSYRFNARAKGLGWRLDHFLVSEALHPRVHDCYLLPQVLGSDHCPLGLVLKLE